MAGDGVGVGCHVTCCMGRPTKFPVRNLSVQSPQHISTNPQLGWLRVNYDLFLVILALLLNLQKIWTNCR
jgi:hypothetical protein